MCSKLCSKQTKKPSEELYNNNAGTQCHCRGEERELWEEAPKQGIVAAGWVVMGLGEFSEYKISDKFGRHQTETKAGNICSRLFYRRLLGQQLHLCLLNHLKNPHLKVYISILMHNVHLTSIGFITSNLTLTCSRVISYLREGQLPLASIRRLQSHSCAQRPPRVHQDPSIDNNTNLLLRNPSSL